MNASDELLDFLAAGPSPQQLVGFEPSAQTRQRVIDLIRREKTGSLTPEERQELAQFARFDQLMRLVKARARPHPPGS